MLKREREGVLYPCIISIGEAIDLVVRCEFVDSRESVGAKDKTRQTRRERQEMRTQDWGTSDIVR